MTWDWSGESFDALTTFLYDRELLSGQITTRAIGDGHSNLTFLVGDGTRSVVVRRPPPPPIPPGANDMLREARLLTALAPTPVPVPRVLAVADAGEVIDVPLYVMSFAPGPVVTARTPAPLDTPDQRKLIGHSLVDTLADLHQVDLPAVGLESLGKPEGFNVRHLRRMSGLIADGNGDLPDDFTEITQWLTAHTPPESGAALVHCDYRIGNVILAPGTPGRIAAVLDWELATLGDPLFDVGYLLATVPEPGRPHNPTAELSAALLEEGYPSKTELAQRYSERTGRDLSNLDWYTCLALWKLAVLYEYSRRRVHDGIGDPYYADPALVQRFLADARRTAGLAEVHGVG